MGGNWGAARVRHIQKPECDLDSLPSHSPLYPSPQTRHTPRPQLPPGIHPRPAHQSPQRHRRSRHLHHFGRELARQHLADLQMRGIVERMTEAGIQLHLTEPARRWLAEKGYDPQFGARPLRRALQRFVENPLSVQLLKGEFQQGDLVVIDEINGQLEFLRNHDASTDYMRFQQDQYTDNLR
jgi:hypothetical protein